ncbi:MAG: T9SS type A sorting domain-containing protein [Balneolales bacterium]
MFFLFTNLFSSIDGIYEVRGILSTETEAPIINHRVILYDANDEVTASVQSDSLGRFKLTYQAGTVSSVPELAPDSPSEFRLGASYPNPFNPRVSIPFEVPENTSATIAVYNILGQRLMQSHVDINRGSHEISVTLAGSLSQGQYLLHVQGDRFSLTESMTFVSAGINSGAPGITVNPGKRIRSHLAGSIQTTDFDMYRLVIEETGIFLRNEMELPANENYDAGTIVLSYKNEINEPYPIHKSGSDFVAPLTYKGLDLALTDTGIPAISDSDGIIGMVCIGMSNSAQECDRYIQALSNEFSNEVSQQIHVINCARGGHAIEKWNDPEFDSVLWEDCAENISNSDLTLSQIRVVLHKAANQFTGGPNRQPLPFYPDPASDYFNFQENLSVFSDRVTDFFPDLQAVFTTSRSYGGFSDNPRRGEPLSYEEGHALNQWLLENGSVKEVWFGWGPYIWAPSCYSGINNGLGYCYERDDYVNDGVHPSDSGRFKIAQMWHLKLSEYDWYRK